MLEVHVQLVAPLLDVLHVQIQDVQLVHLLKYLKLVVLHASLPR